LQVPENGSVQGSERLQELVYSRLAAVPVTNLAPAQCISTAPFIAFTAPIRPRPSAPRVVRLFRLTNEDVSELYSRGNVGTEVIVPPMDRRADNADRRRGKEITGVSNEPFDLQCRSHDTPEDRGHGVDGCYRGS
jgi:hypothetical protein